MARKIMRRFKLSEISAVDMPAQEGARIVLTKRKDMTQLSSKKIVKYVGRKSFSSTDFAYVGDAKKPETWKLRRTSEPGGEVSRVLVTKAVDAMGTQMADGATPPPKKYHIPEDAIDAVLNRLRDAWHLAYPNSAPADVPAPIKE